MELDNELKQPGPDALSWATLTTGGFSGFDAWLADERAGLLRIDAVLVKAEIAVGDIGLDDIRLEAGGIACRIRVFRLPDDNPRRWLHLTRRIRLKTRATNPVCVPDAGGRAPGMVEPINVFR